MTGCEGAKRGAAHDEALSSRSLLVTFCNFPTPQATGLFRLAPAAEACSQVALGFPHDMKGCTGIAGDEERIYALCVSQGMHHLTALARNTLEFLFSQPLPEVKDGHSILAKGEHLYVVSTGTDEVIRYHLAPKGLSDRQVVWRASLAGCDTHHVNSISSWEGSVVVSAFGPKFATLWTSALEGYIHDISRDVRIKNGIYHPHSLSVRGDRLYYLESHRKLLCSLDGPLFSVPGYPRGVCWLSDDLVCIGSNVGRRLSKSTGLIANSADPGEPSGSCGITVGDTKKGRHVKRLDLGWVGGEIYDILAESASQE